MHTKRIEVALRMMDIEFRLSRFEVIGWQHSYDTPLDEKKRHLRAKTKGIVKHDRVLNWRKP